MPDLIKIYHHLPYPLRTLAASARGYYLKWWRYGPQTERLVEEASERETWSAKQWKDWQEERLAYILDRAAGKVPYYQDYWRKRRQNGDHASWDIVENWPILKKVEVRQNPQAFIAEDCDVRRLFHEHTSGSTGTPVQLWFSRQVLHSWFALFEARWRRWHGVSRKDRWAMIGGQQVAPFEQITPPFWVWNAGLNQLYMSALHIRPDFLSYYLEAIQQYAISYLYGYSSGLYWLAIQAIEDHIRIPVRVVITDAEPLFEWQREAIHKAFDCPVRETYGQAEMVSAAGECEQGNLHLWPDGGYSELLDEYDHPAQPGKPGRLIGTSLLNEDMPLVRYETSDMAILSDPKTVCVCGRTLPLVEKIMGRMDDFIITPDGRRVLLADIIFSPSMHLYEAQIIQESLDQFTIKVVPTEDWSDTDEEKICSAIRRRVGDVEVTVELVPAIDRTWAGKFKVMVSKIPQSTSTKSIA